MTKDNLKERTQTVRQAIVENLKLGQMTALDLSGLVSVSEKDVISHLEHVAKSEKHFVIEPSECISCGFIFEGRKRLTKPSSCPECKKQRISRPEFHIQVG